MTKPAAVFAQILGALLAFYSIGLYSQGSGSATFVLLSGIVLFLAGGWSARNKMKMEKAKAEKARSG